MSVAYCMDVLADASVSHLSVDDPAVVAAFHDLPQDLEFERLSVEGRLA